MLAPERLNPAIPSERPHDTASDLLIRPSYSGDSLSKPNVTGLLFDLFLSVMRMFWNGKGVLRVLPGLGDERVSPESAAEFEALLHGPNLSPYSPQAAQHGTDRSVLWKK